MTEHEARSVELKERQAVIDEYAKAIESGRTDIGNLLLRELMMYDRIIEAWKSVPNSKAYVKYTSDPMLQNIAGHL